MARSIFTCPGVHGLRPTASPAIAPCYQIPQRDFCPYTTIVLLQRTLLVRDRHRCSTLAAPMAILNQHDAPLSLNFPRCWAG
jgi:hypothetical protein